MEVADERDDLKIIDKRDDLRVVNGFESRGRFGSGHGPLRTM